MNPVSNFLHNIQSQFEFLKELAEYDEYLETPLAWKRRTGRVVNGCRRRGWTRQDKNRGELRALVEDSKLLNPPSFSKRYCGRVYRYLCMWDFTAPVCDFAQEAIDYVSDLPQYAETIGPAVTEMLRIHIEWVQYMKNNRSSDVAYRWEIAKAKLDGISEMLRQMEKVEPNPLRDIERDIPDRCKPIWKIIVRMSRQKRPSFYEDIRTELLNKNLEYPLGTIEKYIREIKNFCDLHSVRVDTFERGSKKILLKI
jgi:hypothetical protein